MTVPLVVEQLSPYFTTLAPEYVPLGLFILIYDWML